MENPYFTTMPIPFIREKFKDLEEFEIIEYERLYLQYLDIVLRLFEATHPEGADGLIPQEV